MSIVELNTERKRVIEDKVNALIDKDIALREPGFDIVKFLTTTEKFRIATAYMKNDIISLLLVDDIKLLEPQKTHKLIIVEQHYDELDNSVAIKRFLVACQYAHYILHKNHKKQYAYEITRKSNMDDIEAEYFARCLLIQSNILNEILSLNFIKELSDSSKVELISRIFRVTETIATKRLNDIL